jgi:hypothetical protein
MFLYFVRDLALSYLVHVVETSIFAPSSSFLKYPGLDSNILILLLLWYYGFLFFLITPVSHTGS